MEGTKKCVGLLITLKIFFLVSALSGCVSFSAFASLFGTSVSIACSAIGLKLRTITAGKSISQLFKKKRKEHDKLDTIEVLSSQASIDTHICYAGFISTNNVL